MHNTHLSRFLSGCRHTTKTCLFHPPGAPRHHNLPFSRPYGSTAPSAGRRMTRALVRGAGVSVGLGALLLGTVALESSSLSGKDLDIEVQHPLRTYLVYTLCRSSILSSILSASSESPWISSILNIPGVHAIVKKTFFDQFVGGETAAEAIVVARDLRNQGVGALLAYSVEADPNATDGQGGGKTVDDLVEEMVRSIDVAADFEDALNVGRAGLGSRHTWVAVKMSALLPRVSSLTALTSYILQIRASDAHITPPSQPLALLLNPSTKTASTSYPQPLSPEDTQDLTKLYADLLKICERAEQRGVRIIIDAEYSWFQPAIDFLQLSLMQRFNAAKSKSQDSLALIYGTYQAYLTRTPAHLEQSIAYARHNGFVLGVKLVRGAYWEQEAASGRSTNPVVWMQKSDTDACYNATAMVLLQALKASQVNILFGTHNPESCRVILQGLAQVGLATMSGAGYVIPPNVRERLCFGTLYGMSTQLATENAQRMASPSPMTLKYIPYGELAEVMPYLARRAVENRSVLMSPGAEGERLAAGRGILKGLRLQ